MKGLNGALVGAMLAVTACTQAGSNNLSSSTPSPDMSPSAAASASPGGVAIVVGQASNAAGKHAVYLIGVNGVILATATAMNPSPISSWPLASPILNLWSTYATASDDRAYYRDGDNSVRYLDRAGGTGEVARVPGDGTKR